MSIKNLGVPITLDVERNLIFNLNVLEKCIEKYGSMDALLNEPMANITATKWLAVEMLNEDAEIWNEDHPDNKKPLLDEKRLARLTDGLGGIQELQAKVNQAMLKGLPEDKVQEVEELGKNLIAAQSQSVTMNREQRRKAKKK